LSSSSSSRHLPLLSCIRCRRWRAAAAARGRGAHGLGSGEQQHAAWAVASSSTRPGRWRAARGLGYGEQQQQHAAGELTEQQQQHPGERPAVGRTWPAEHAAGVGSSWAGRRAEHVGMRLARSSRPGRRAEHVVGADLAARAGRGAPSRRGARGPVNGELGVLLQPLAPMASS
jgi:hypothetical protein